MKKFVLAALVLASLTTAKFISAAALPFPPAASPTPGPKLQDLPKLDIDLSRITVSGVSSGGFMAVQMHVAYSSIFKGAASIAGGAWECAKGDVNRSQNVCMNGPAQIDVNDLAQLARDRASRGEIDDLANLSSSRVAIFASPNDMVIKPLGSDKLEEFYATFMPKPSITRLTNRIAAHGFPTLAYGNKCSMMGTPWILNCNDDVAGKLLAAVEPASRTLAARGKFEPASILYFDQTKHVAAAARMYGWGAAYIPKACSAPAAKCGVHVALHGCQMNPDFIQQQFVENAGYNEWAESNNLVILYPQSAKGPGNPYACWDWFGFTGSNYTTKSGVQIDAIRKILADLGAS